MGRVSGLAVAPVPAFKLDSYLGAGSSVEGGGHQLSLFFFLLPGCFPSFINYEDPGILLKYGDSMSSREKFETAITVSEAP